MGSSLSNKRILTEEEINRVRDKFSEDVDFVYEEAIARHVSILRLICLEKHCYCKHPDLLLDFVCLVRLRQHHGLPFQPHFVLPPGINLRLPRNCLPTWPLADLDERRLPSGKKSSECIAGQNPDPYKNLTA